MKLLILAAGTGSRLYPLTRNTPKSLLDLGDGVSLLERQIEAAIKSEYIEEVCIVTGYKAGQIDEKIKEYSASIPISTIFNPFFDVSNNLVSIWCARSLFLENDVLITNGDNLYKEVVFPEVRKQEEGIYLTISRKNEYDDDDMKVILTPNMTVSHVSKDVPLADVSAESVGLVGVYGDRYRKVFISNVTEMMKDKANLKVYWLRAFNELVANGIEVNTVEIGSDEWSEMDFHPDINSIREEVIQKLNRDLDIDSMGRTNNGG
ncbi:hypothetical protein A9Q99_26100 [Gammaproteobacteria bacterium 45_16_T64]|nr:hypothetical protein A9Q99_26100 [Gammaproteobacteria bacterium 45_16_T64]